MRFRDRRDAGRALAGALRHLTANDPVVLGLARGGVPVAVEVAAELGTAVDVLVVRKVGALHQPELAVGAVAEDGVTIVDSRLASRVGMDDAAVEAVAARERAELERRLRRYRGDRDARNVHDRTVIVVDDGIATGATARAAVEVLRARGAAHVVVAAPVASRPAAARLREVADEVVCLSTPRGFLAVGEAYDDFTATSDAEVVAALAEADRGGGTEAGEGTDDDPTTPPPGR